MKFSSFLNESIKRFFFYTSSIFFVSVILKYLFNVNMLLTYSILISIMLLIIIILYVTILGLALGNKPEFDELIKNIKDNVK